MVAGGGGASRLAAAIDSHGTSRDIAGMSAIIAKLFRYPVKGLSPQRLDRVDLSVGDGMPGDRRYALARSGVVIDPTAPTWMPKRNFLMLQQAHSTGDVALIKDVTTVEMFEALRPQINEQVARGDSLDVSNLEASLLEVTTESEYHWASIRFHGMMQEGPGATPAPFEEVWNLRKSVASNSGWLLAGIQQVS